MDAVAALLAMLEESEDEMVTIISSDDSPRRSMRLPRQRLLDALRRALRISEP